MNSGRVIVHLRDVTNTCFVAMPFHDLYTAEYDRVIRPAIGEAGLICVRGDEIYARPAIVQDVWNSICNARLVVAELSGRNPNVMYEVGLAHAIGKPIILLTRSEDDVPFDLRSLRYIYYDTNDPFCGENLRKEITRLVRLAMDNPATSTHLERIEIQAALPDAPVTPVSLPEFDDHVRDLSGTWKTSWTSIRFGREHSATLVIPTGHGSEFVASMVITYSRNTIQTIVHESLTGSLNGNALRLVGVNYTYIQKGKSVTYGLDSFDLNVSDSCDRLDGLIVLRYGSSQVIFVKER